MSDTVNKIKQQVSIIELAEKIGFELIGNGNTVGARHNKIRQEKSCSIKFYRNTNTFTDFGSGESGSVIDLYMLAYGTSLSDTIKILSEENGINGDREVIQRVAPIPQQEYMKPEIVRKIFDQQIDLDFKDKEHKKLLDTIAPKHIFKSAKDEDIAYFVEIVKRDKHSNTLAVLLHDEHKIERSIRYRNKIVGEDMKKWVALSGSQSSVLYTRLTSDPITYVVEGTHDLLTCILLGFSVIALPSASWKGSISHELTKERTLIFIGDDNEVGQKAIDDIMAETVCEKKRFNYQEFREKYSAKGEDFSDLCFSFKSADEFKSAMGGYISSLGNALETDWTQILRSKNKTVTRKTIDEAENIRFLFDGVLPHNQITTFVGKPNVGKSAITFAIINNLFKRKEIDNIIYFDADNPLVYTKDRILALMDKHGDDAINYYTGSTATKDEMIEALQMLTNFKGGGIRTIVVIDSLKNFISGSINDDKSLNPMFDTLQSVRDIFGATIINLHHTRKGKDDDGKLNYVGSQVIEASSDNMTYLSKIEDSGYMLLENAKARALITPKVSFRLDFDKMEIFEEDLPPEEEEDNKSEPIEDRIIKFLNGKKLKQADIAKALKISKGKLIDIVKVMHNVKSSKDGEEWMLEPTHSVNFTTTEYVEDDIAQLNFEAGEVF